MVNRILDQHNLGESEMGEPDVCWRAGHGEMYHLLTSRVLEAVRLQLCDCASARNARLSENDVKPSHTT